MHSFRCKSRPVRSAIHSFRSFPTAPTNPIPLPAVVAILIFNPILPASSRLPPDSSHIVLVFFVAAPISVHQNQNPYHGNSTGGNSDEADLGSPIQRPTCPEILSARHLALLQRCIWTSSGGEHHRQVPISSASSSRSFRNNLLCRDQDRENFDVRREAAQRPEYVAKRPATQRFQRQAIQNWKASDLPVG